MGSDLFDWLVLDCNQFILSWHFKTLTSMSFVTFCNESTWHFSSFRRLSALSLFNLSGTCNTGEIPTGIESWKSRFITGVDV